MAHWQALWPQYPHVYSYHTCTPTALTVIHCPASELSCAGLSCPQLSHIPTTASEQILELDQGDWEGALRAECYTPQQVVLLVMGNKQALELSGRRVDKLECGAHGFVCKSALALHTILHVLGISRVVYVQTVLAAEKEGWPACCGLHRMLHMHHVKWDRESSLYMLAQVAIIDKDPWNFAPPNGESQRMVRHTWHAIKV